MKKFWLWATPKNKKENEINHGMTSHILWMCGSFLAVLLIQWATGWSLAFLFPLLCIGMMVFMMINMAQHNGKHN
ncbi:hypothetical protein BH09PAT4_BH09PAT4_00190 [soil metagenome]